MRIVGKHKAQSTVAGEAIEDEIHHRMAVSDQMLPEELAPAVAHLSVNGDTAFAMNVPYDVVAGQIRVRKGRQERADITTAVWHEPNPNGTAVEAASGLSQNVRFLLVIGCQQKIASRTVRSQPAQEVCCQLRVEEVRMHCDSQRDTCRSAAGGGRRNHFMPPWAVRPAASNVVGERIHARGVVMLAVLVRVNLRVKAGARTTK